ncbi:hypothetical protein CPHO_09235 [Corynebacterium phocae]|uniref:Uncharacterized protein n=1 Tax=Corynebacterium phocae TaxID=161895 RepID=A0A1L7D4D1_9CORY|nr:hypothetical protein [Corynebacterium phocae]APT93036.1 hypothetical protein CPHO_09235 [Corynebacterium phocae]KAA8722527.1 hypothetical protein F4V58_08725 [Corynebacterium phocae]
MSNAEIQGINPAWPVDTSRDHIVTEIAAPFQGATSPYGDDLVLPMPAEKTGYVHPYTRINR